MLLSFILIFLYHSYLLLGISLSPTETCFLQLKEKPFVLIKMTFKQNIKLFIFQSLDPVQTADLLTLFIDIFRARGIAMWLLKQQN